MTVEETADQIKKLEIQGATAVATSAIRALEEWAEGYEGESFLGELSAKSNVLISSRPTEPMMRNAIRFIASKAKKGGGLQEMKAIVKEASQEFLDHTSSAIEKIAKIGAKRIPRKGIVMTHCHSSVVMKILKEALDEGKKFEVICPEARPRFQGRISARELGEFGIPVTLIVDSAVRRFMKRTDVVMVGADAICANGSVINKIGSAMIALCAKEFETPFVVAAETFKFDPETALGEAESIEERPAAEVLEGEIEGVQVRNPAFDETPPEYIDSIITEEGIVSPYAVNNVIRKKFGYMFERMR